ncbi:T9SS type A sorting domain-containing protein [Parabacteroides sp. OttesenSCG-928-O15]|nr:T9SS type A sorting domain-containing protein [Parabacteroides sp. OttesenSCG-928-O15]
MRIVYCIGIMLLLQTGVWLSAQEKKTDTATAVPQKVTTVEEEKDEPKITVTENCISVSNAPVGSKMEIFSVVGTKVKEIEMKESSGEYQVNLEKGIYMVRIGPAFVRKMLIH